MKLNVSYSELVNKVQSEGKEVYRFCVSDERVNRNGWKIITAGIDYSEYKDNPVVLLGHWGDIPIGKSINVFSENDKLFADIWFHEQDEDSALVKKLVDLEVLTMTSIGIRVLKRGTPIPIPPDDKDKYPFWQDVIEVFTQSELREISVVPIPANSGAKYQEKLNNAFNSNVFSSNEKLILSNYFNPEESINNNLSTHNQKDLPMTLEGTVKKILKKLSFNQTNITEENNILSNKNEDISMTIEEAVKEIGILQAANKQLKEFESNNAELKSQLEISNTQLAVLIKEKEAAELEIKKVNEANAAKLAEAQVDTDIAKLSDKIKPAENNQENNFKLKRDLLHLKLNEKTLVDADGKSLYNVRLSELEQRESMSYLQDGTRSVDKPITLDTIKDFDAKNMDHRKVLAEKAKELAKTNGTTFEVELYKLMGE